MSRGLLVEKNALHRSRVIYVLVCARKSPVEKISAFRCWRVVGRSRVPETVRRQVSGQTTRKHGKRKTKSKPPVVVGPRDASREWRKPVLTSSGFLSLSRALALRVGGGHRKRTGRSNSATLVNTSPPPLYLGQRLRRRPLCCCLRRRARRPPGPGFLHRFRGGRLSAAYRATRSLPRTCTCSSLAARAPPLYNNVISLRRRSYKHTHTLYTRIPPSLYTPRGGGGDVSVVTYAADRKPSFEWKETTGIIIIYPILSPLSPHLPHEHTRGSMVATRVSKIVRFPSSPSRCSGYVKQCNYFCAFLRFWILLGIARNHDFFFFFKYLLLNSFKQFFKWSFLFLILFESEVSNRFFFSLHKI